MNNINGYINMNMWKDTRTGRTADKASVGLSSGKDGGKLPGGVVPIRATVVFGLGLPGSSLVLPQPVYPWADLLGDGLSYKLWASGVQRG